MRFARSIWRWLDNRAVADSKIDEPGTYLKTVSPRIATGGRAYAIRA